jgi:hypothetical protein
VVLVGQRGEHGRPLHPHAVLARPLPRDARDQPHPARDFHRLLHLVELLEAGQRDAPFAQPLELARIELDQRIDRRAQRVAEPLDRAHAFEAVGCR